MERINKLASVTSAIALLLAGCNGRQPIITDGGSDGLPNDQSALVDKNNETSVNDSKISDGLKTDLKGEGIKDNGLDSIAKDGPITDARKDGANPDSTKADISVKPDLIKLTVDAMMADIKKIADSSKPDIKAPSDIIKPDTTSSLDKGLTPDMLPTCSTAKTTLLVKGEGAGKCKALSKILFKVRSLLCISVIPSQTNNTNTFTSFQAPSSPTPGTKLRVSGEGKVGTTDCFSESDIDLVNSTMQIVDLTLNEKTVTP